MASAVYLDSNATAKVRPEVVRAVAEAMAQEGNASSVHAAGRRARRTVEDARGAVAALVGAAPGQVVFTSGGTEANNQVMRECRPCRTIVSAIEHPAVLEACPGAAQAPVNEDGIVDLGELEAALRSAEKPEWVALMLANNETGVLQPVAEAAEIAHGFGARLHCDAVQAAGKVPLDFAGLGADSLAIAAHKFGGPQGIGALVVRDPDAVSCLLRGGGQERGLRGGTESCAQIAGFGVAARAAVERMQEFAALAELRDRLNQLIAHVIANFS